MHRNWIGPAVALAATVFSAGVLAQATYAGVSVGRSRIDVDCAGTTSCDRTDTAAKLFAGYMFTPNFGAEAAYYDMGEAKLIGQDLTLGDVSAKIRARGFGVFGVASAPLGMFSVFGKLGAVSSKAKVEADSSVFGFGSASERHTNLAWGLAPATTSRRTSGCAPNSSACAWSLPMRRMTSTSSPSACTIASDALHAAAGRRGG